MEYSAQISERNKNIDDLQNQITDLKSQLAQYETTASNTVDDAGASEQKLIEAASNYLQQNLQDAGMLIAENRNLQPLRMPRRRRFIILSRKQQRVL